MQLSAQTHFGQGWNTRLLDDIDSLGIDMIRDGVSWQLVETKPGKYSFNHNRVDWVGDAVAAGLDVMLIFQPTNELYDRGHTVHTKAGLKAFADFVVATLKANPGVTAIEIGNEFNSNDFVSGHVAKAPANKRDDFYKAIVEAVDTALQAAKIDVTIVGASTHSIPVDYIKALKQNGTLDHLDAISIHPYTTEPEEFASQLEVLRSVIGDDMPIHVTEFGDKFEDLREAPAFLAKMVSVMAAADVASANWYAFADQSFFPNMELWDRGAGKATPAGETFKIIEGMLADGASVERIAIDSHTYLYTFGENAAILWGEPRALKLAKGVTAFDLAGRKIANLDMLDPGQPVILRSGQPIDAGSIAFAPSALVADSYHDFDITNEPDSFAGFEGPWSYFAERGTGQVIELYTMGGGLAAGEVWTPYLGVDWLRPMQLNATTLVPVDFTPNKKAAHSEYALVERFTAGADGTYAIRANWDVSDNTRDGVLLTVEVKGKQVLSQVIFNQANGHVFDLNLGDIDLRAGDTIDFVISSRRNATGDVTERKIQIFDQDQLEAPGAVPDPVADPVSPPASSPATPPTSTPPSSAPVEDDAVLIETVFDESAAVRKVVLRGTAGNDALYGGKGNDVLDGLGGANIISAGAGNDRIFTDGNDIAIDGGAGRDMLIVRGGPLSIDLAEASIEIAFGSKLDDVFDGSGLTLAAELRGRNGNDILTGGSGNDKLIGGAGRDLLSGGVGSDTLIGGGGSDVLDGGAGNDRLTGGGGKDSFRFAGDFGHDTITDFRSGDVIDLSAIDDIGSFGDLAISYGPRKVTIAIDDSSIELLNMGANALDAGDFLF